jgi:hypothetical protein
MRSARTVWTPANKGFVIAAMGGEAWKISRDIALLFGDSQSAVLEVLRKYQFHPYHLFRSAHLFTHERPIRMQFCEWLRHECPADELLLHKIPWRYDSVREDVFQAHDIQISAWDNPNAIRECGYKLSHSVSC